MAGSNVLATPESSDDFEAMCHQLYRLVWNDTGCMRVGRSGQSQFGVDILGFDGNRNVGIQCKHYIKTKFTIATVQDDVKKADDDNLQIGHLLFATTAPGQAEIVRQVHELSTARRAAGKFTVSVAFWDDICGHIRMHPAVGRSFIPGFPGSTILQIDQKSTETLKLVREINLKLGSAPGASGTEADPRVVQVLDLVREKIREGKTSDAWEMLNNLGDPSTLTDQFSRFRWYTNKAAIDLANGDHALAAQGCLDAFRLAPDQEVAHFNRVRAYILLDDIQSAVTACKEALALFPDSATVWSLHIFLLEKEGDTAPFEAIPASVAESRDILLMKAELHHKRSEHQEAIALLKKAVEIEPNQNDGKRAYLAEALSWASQDTVQAHFHHMSEERRELLRDAVSRFEPLEISLPAIQSDHISFEITNNICVALVLLGEQDRARTVAALSLQRHPHSDGLLRIRISQLAEQNDFDSIREITDSRLSELPPILLAQLAEISANAGQVSWYDIVMQQVEAKLELDKRLEELRAFRALAVAISGEVDQGLQLAEAYANANPTQLFAKVIAVQIFQRTGDEENAASEAKKCLAHLNSNSSRADVLQIADLLYEHKLFVEAAPLFERLVSSPGADSLTWRLLVSLLKSDSRAKVQNVLNVLPARVRNQPDFRRIECDLTRRTSDWQRMKALLQLDIAENPGSCDVALGYVGALYQLGDTEALAAFLSKDIDFKDTSPETEYEYAKHQIFHGFEELGIYRIYRLYRNNPSNTKIASYFVALSLMCKNWGAVLVASSVHLGTAYELKSGSETWWMAIEQTNSLKTAAWPELVKSNSTIAAALDGCQLGDTVSLFRGFANQDCDVISKIPLLGFAQKKAHEQLAASPIPQGPVWAVSVDSLVNSIKTKTADVLKNTQESHIKNCFQKYAQVRIPLCTLAKIINVDLISLLADWNERDGKLNVSTGTTMERNEEYKPLQVISNRYVFDLFSISELVRHDVFEATVKAIGKPLIPASLRAYVLRLLHAEQSHHTACRPRRRREQLPGIKDLYLGNRKAFLEKILKTLDQYCELLPVYGPKELTTDQREISDLLDESHTDVVYLCLEKNAVLMSEDFHLRILAKQIGVKHVLGIQPILIGLRDSGAITSKKYSDALARKIHDGHYFVNISAIDLLQWANIDKKRVNSIVKMVLIDFQKHNADFRSSLRVFCEFIVSASKDISVDIVARYIEVGYASLSSRLNPEHSTILTKEVGRLLQALYGKGGRKLPTSQRRLFGDFFNKNA